MRDIFLQNEYILCGSNLIGSMRKVDVAYLLYVSINRMTDSEVKDTPIKLLETILIEKKNYIDTLVEKYRGGDNMSLITNHSKLFNDSRELTINRPEIHFFNEQDKVALLEPIINLFVDMQMRIESLEKRVEALEQK
jgi:hypothetical protein